MKGWIIDSKEHHDLALNFIKLEQSFRGLPLMREAFEAAKGVIRAAPHAKTASGDLILTTPPGGDTTLQATALDRALQAIGITTYTARLSHNDVMVDIDNNAERDKSSLEGFFHKPTYNQVEFTIPSPNLLQELMLKY